MKETIYTIPITEIYEEKCFCPFCKLFDRLEQEEIKYALGPAMMEPDYRAITNEKGFCAHHMKELNALPKALALSLVLESHYKNVKKALFSDFEPTKKGILSKKADRSDLYIQDIAAFNHDCTICSRIEHHFERYISTFIDMLRKNKDFLEKVSASDGFCMPHFERILFAARKKLSDKEYSRIAGLLRESQLKKFEKYEKDIAQFIESFDYHNANKPCKAPGDTVIMASRFLNGEFEKPDKKLEDV